MQGITPHLWFDKEAVEAAEFYTKTLPGSQVGHISRLYDTPSGDTDVVSFALFGQPFMAISAGPLFRFNPSVSFLIHCSDAGEVDRLWDQLADGGAALMPLDEYPFSKRYGWAEDRYGLSWQVMLSDGPVPSQRITPMLLFVGDLCGKAEEAVELYTSVFPGSRIDHILRHEAGEELERPGTVKHATFALAGYDFSAMDSAADHEFAFNEAISFMVNCDSQDEIDHYWERLSAVPEAEQCGWLKDRYGLSWQVVPSALGEMLGRGTKEQIERVTAAFLPMKKFDLAVLTRAFEGR